MQQVDTLYTAADRKTVGSAGMEPASAKAPRQTPGAWRRFADGAAACFAQNTADSESRAGNTLGKYDPFLILY